MCVGRADRGDRLHAPTTARGDLSIVEGQAAQEFNGGGRVEAAREYLDRWRQLDHRLESRVAGRAVCFGASEAAGLLRAYAPRTWGWVRACTVDGLSEGSFGTLPIVPLETVGRDETILLGVRPSDQARVAERLSTSVARVVTWYDLV
jgi:hypothetical protein